MENTQDIDPSAKLPLPRFTRDFDCVRLALFSKGLRHQHIYIALKVLSYNLVGKHCCWSNEKFAPFCNLSKERVSLATTELARAGWIEKNENSKVAWSINRGKSGRELVATHKLFDLLFQGYEDEQVEETGVEMEVSPLDRYLDNRSLYQNDKANLQPVDKVAEETAENDSAFTKTIRQDYQNDKARFTKTISNKNNYKNINKNKEIVISNSTETKETVSANVPAKTYGASPALIDDNDEAAVDLFEQLHYLYRRGERWLTSVYLAARPTVHDIEVITKALDMAGGDREAVIDHLREIRIKLNDKQTHSIGRLLSAHTSTHEPSAERAFESHNSDLKSYDEYEPVSSFFTRAENKQQETTREPVTIDNDSFF